MFYRPWSEVQADRYATRLALHPGQVWPEWWDSIEPGPLPATDPRHGTANAYNNLDCRCDACRDARRAYRRNAKSEYSLPGDNPDQRSVMPYTRHRQPPLAPLLTSIPKAAEALGISPAYGYRLADQGVIPTIRIGSRRLVAIADLERLVAEWVVAGQQVDATVATQDANGVHQRGAQ